MESDRFSQRRSSSGRGEIWILRHGESTFNTRPDPEIDPIDFDARLTDRGRRQAVAVAARIRLLGPDLIVSSPLTRALQTAQIVACGQTPVLIEPLIRERQVNTCDVGRPASLLRGEFPGFGLGHLPETWWYLGNGNESPDARGVLVEPEAVLADRVHRFRRWLRDRPGQRIVVIGHQGFFRQLANRELDNCELVHWTD